MRVGTRSPTPMPAPRPHLRVPAWSLRRSLAAAGRGQGLPSVEAARASEDAGVRAWADAAEAAGLEGTDGRFEAKDPPASGGLEAAFRDPLPGPDPAGRLTAAGPHPVGPLTVNQLREAVPAGSSKALVLPARRGRIVETLRSFGVEEVLAHEPDPRWRDHWQAKAVEGVVLRSEPATEIPYDRRVEAVVADRPLYGTRSLVGLLGRLHHALEDGGVLVLHDVLMDEAEADDVGGNRVSRSLRVHLRARGRDLVSRQDLWRLLIETGFQGVRFEAAAPGRYVVRARK